MKIDFMYSRSTGRSEHAERALREAIEATGVEPEIVYTEVESFEDAKTYRFLGSPTIRVDGMDVEYGEREPEEWQTGTRYYNTPEGWKPYPHAKLIANIILENLQRKGAL